MVVSSNRVGGEILTTKEHKRQLAEKKRFYMLIRVVIITRLYICQNSNYTFFNGYSLLYANQTSRKLLYKEKTRYSYMSNLVKRSRNICITSFFLTLDLLLFIRNIFRKGLPLVSIAGKHKNFAFVKIKGKVMGKNTCHWGNSYPPLPLWTQADIRT